MHIYMYVSNNSSDKICVFGLCCNIASYAHTGFTFSFSTAFNISQQKFLKEFIGNMMYFFVKKLQEKFPTISTATCSCITLLTVLKC